MSPMPGAPNIYLIGFMAAGKTTVGRVLARMAKRKFIDLDEEIERRAGKRISKLFREAGEEGFRDLERALLDEYSRQSGLVIALGGGAFCSPENQRLVRASGISIWLETGIEVLVARLNGKTDRPLNISPESLEQLYRERLPHYRSADLRVFLTNDTPRQAAVRVMEALRTHTQAGIDV